MKLDGVMIWVKDVEATLNFYERAFGFEREMLTDEKDYGQLKTGDTVLSFAREDAAKKTGLEILLNRSEDKARGWQLALVSDDVEAAFQKALGEGAKLEVELVEKPWGQKLGYLRDPNGILIEVSSVQAW